MSETIPAVPDNATPEQLSQLHAEFARLGLIIANNGNDIAQISEIAANERHRAAMAAAQARHDAANGPMTLGDFAAALAARAPLGVTVEELNVATQARWAWLQGLSAPALPVDPPAPAPVPAPPAPAPLVPPAELSDAEAAWYLEQLRAEFERYSVPTTIEFAKEHWRKWGKPQGRKWAANAPPPAWGPRAEEAPAGTPL